MKTPTHYKDDLFTLPIEDYLRERERSCQKSLKLLGLYDHNKDLAPMIVGVWYRQYYEYKIKELA